MNPFNDAAAERSNRRVIDARRRQAAEEDARLLLIAKQFRGPGVPGLIDTIWQRERMAITEDYARDLLARA